MKATVTELIIPKEKYDNVQKIMSSALVWFKKKEKLMAVVGFRSCFCCVCHEISSPLYEVRYSSEGVVRFEIYCSTHIETYHKTKNSTSEELAAKHNCQIGEVPPSYFDPWDKQNG